MGNECNLVSVSLPEIKLPVPPVIIQSREHACVSYGVYALFHSGSEVQCPDSSCVETAVIDTKAKCPVFHWCLDDWGVSFRLGRLSDVQLEQSLDVTFSNGSSFRLCAVWFTMDLF